MIHVLVAEDQHVVRDASVALLGREDDLDVVAVVGRGDEALAAEPDVAVLDIEMPGVVETGARPLTERETDVLRVVATGRSTEEVGDDLTLSPATVRNHLSNAVATLHADNRIDAINIARDNGWLA